MALQPLQLLPLILGLARELGRQCIEVDEASRKLFINPARLRNLAERLAEEAGDSIKLEGNAICVTDPITLAIRAVQLGASETVVAKALDWRDFEAYTAKALEEAGYTVYRSLRLTWPKGFEVDVLGLDKPSKTGIVVDCKHWNPRNTPPSRLREAARRHRERTGRLARYWWKLGLPKGPWQLIPVLIVLREHNLPRITEGVLVVPVSKLKGFLQELPELRELEEVYKTETIV